MGLLDIFKPKKNPNPNTTNAKSEFDMYVFELLENNNTQDRNDICKIIFDKAITLLKQPTQNNVHRAYDLMGNLASQFEYIPAIMWMGDFVENVMQNPKQAVYWYKKAAELGDGNGARCYADMLMTGNGTPRNPKLAIEYYSIASDKGIPEAAFVIGEFLRNSGNRDAALAAYQKAANLGYNMAQIRVDQMLNDQI